MARKIIGQCSTADFRDLEHLVTLPAMDIEAYVHNLNSRQQAALKVLNYFQLCGIPFEVLLKLKEVLIWEMPDHGLSFEYKLLDARDIKTQNILRTMKPRRVKSRV